MHDIEALSTDIVLEKEHLCEKNMQKICTKRKSQTPF